MRAAIWLYLVLFVAFFDLHAQQPILSPFALALGASPTFIGLLLGLYALSHIPGEWLSGSVIQKRGSHIVIAFSLLFTGLILLLQAWIAEPWQLTVTRVASGFVLAFLSPACMTLLTSLESDKIKQERLLAGHGIIHMVAAVLAPTIGTFLVSQFGFGATFITLGVSLMFAGSLSFFVLKPLKSHRHPSADPYYKAQQPALHQFYIPFAFACSQAILYYELPLQLARDKNEGMLALGSAFAIISMGAACTLLIKSLAAISPLLRSVSASILLAISLYGLAIDWPIPFSLTLLAIGMCKGILYPALTSLLIQHQPSSSYSHLFALLSISYSLGAFLGPLLASLLRATVSSYFIASLMLLLIVWIAIHRLLQDNKSILVKKGDFRCLSPSSSKEKTIAVDCGDS